MRLTREEARAFRELLTLAPLGEGLSGNGCGGFGVVAIDWIEKIAADMNRPGGPTSCPKTGCGLELKSPLTAFRLRVDDLAEKLRRDPSQYDRRDIFVPNMDKVDEKTMRECLPNFAKFVDNFIARREEALENQRRAKLPVNRLYRAYRLYSFIQLCNQVRGGYLATDINDVELRRARTASKAIEKAAIAEDPTIDPNKTFAEADKSARSALSRFKGLETSEGFRRECKSALNELLSASPVSPYQTHRP